MLWLVLALLLILVAAAAVIVYVAYPQRGEEVPHVPWLGAALTRGVEALPALDGELSPRIPSQDARREQHPENQPHDESARS